MKAEILAHPVKFALITLAGIICVGFGLLLRLDSLEKRPLHADEATGARILAERLETGSYAFDPVHFHGPLLTAVAEPIARFRGENDWQSLSPGTLRLGTALFGGLTVLLALGFYPWMGSSVLLAAAFIATSPFLVYYSRVFIHETLFAFLAIGTVLALFAYLEKPTRWRVALVGITGGLLMATRETFVICAFAWAVAGGLVMIEQYRRGACFIGSSNYRRLAVDSVVAAFVACLVAAAFYTNWGTHPSGIIDFVRTFFLYETVTGHDKPLWYYSWLMIWPKFQGGVWWTEAGIALAAVGGYALSFRHGRGSWIRFFFYAAVVQWLVYSLIAYKTPWLILTAWLHLCVVAGAGIGGLFKEKALTSKVCAVILFLPLLWWQNTQTDRAVHRYASDPRNPYAYVPTSSDIERVQPFLAELGALFPEVKAGPIAVIGSGYWPLPWYLRGLPATGYWPTLPENGAEFPALLVLPAEFAATREVLGETHTTLPRGLRANTRIYLLIRNDLWDAYLNLDEEND